MVRQIAAKFYMVIKLDEQKLFTVSTTLPSLAIFFHTNAEARSICSSLPSCYCLFTSDKLQNRAAQYTLTDVVQSDICFVRWSDTKPASGCIHFKVDYMCRMSK